MQTSPISGRDGKPTLLFQGRGVHFLMGCVRCPLAGIGSRADHASNRIAIDDGNSRVEVDCVRRRIIWINEHRYDRTTMVGDLLSLGVATAESGAIVPFAVHIPIEKTKSGFAARRDHVHPATTEKLIAAELEPFEVVCYDGKRETTLAPEPALDAIRRPPLASRLLRSLIEVRDELGSVAPQEWRYGARRADFSVRFGLGMLSKLVLRAQVVCLDEAGGMPGSLSEMLAQRAWELTLTSHSNLRDPREHIRRGLFLLGLEGLPALRNVEAHGLKPNQSLTFRYTTSRGFVQAGGVADEVVNVVDIARMYLEFDFLGAILAHTLMAQFAAPNQHRAAPVSIVL